MNPAFAIAEQMLMDRLMSNKAPLTGESKIKLILLTFSGVMILGTIGFALYAMYLWLSSNYAPTTVMFSMAGAMATLSVLAINMYFAISAYKRRKIKQKRDEMIVIAKDILSVANHEFSEPIKDNPLTATLIAAFSGYVVGDRFL